MEFRLLGPLEALSDGRPLPIGGQKQRGVLALLLLHANEVVSTDRLIDEVWGARPPKSVDASLQNCISHLRNVVGREAIETRPPGYRLNVDPERVDALRFERALDAARTLDPPERAAALREALALWRGPPLADVEFGASAGTEIARIEELRLTALEERIDAELALGRHDAILGEIEALAARHPVRERLRRQQMLALYRAGRQRGCAARLPGGAARAGRGVRARAVGGAARARADDHRPRPGARSRRRRPTTRRTASGATWSSRCSSSSTWRTTGVREEPAAALAEIAIIVDRHEGEVRQLLAEELVAVFGSPVAHDDDTLRALRAVGEARAALPERFVLRAAVERLAGERGRGGSARRRQEPARTGRRRRPAARPRGVACRAGGGGRRPARVGRGISRAAVRSGRGVVRAPPGHADRRTRRRARRARRGTRGGGAEPIRASHRPARRAGDRQDAARERVPLAGGEQGAHAVGAVQGLRRRRGPAAAPRHPRAARAARRCPCG